MRQGQSKYILVRGSPDRTLAKGQAIRDVSLLSSFQHIWTDPTLILSLFRLLPCNRPSFLLVAPHQFIQVTPEQLSFRRRSNRKPLSPLLANNLRLQHLRRSQFTLRKGSRLDLRTQDTLLRLGQDLIQFLLRPGVLESFLRAIPRDQVQPFPGTSHKATSGSCGQRRHGQIMHDLVSGTPLIRIILPLLNQTLRNRRELLPTDFLQEELLKPVRSTFQQGI